VNRFSSTVTGALSSVLSSFIVSSRKDFFALKAAAQAAQVRPPNVYTMAFNVPQHQIPPSREPPSDILTVRRVLQVCFALFNLGASQHVTAVIFEGQIH
jgi:hypothetical protein